MSDPEVQNQPLLAPPNPQPDINAQGGRSTRAYKVAGITLLACILIVGQATIAYFLLSQSGDIKSLKEQNNNLKSQLTKGRSVAVPARMHMPMNALPELMGVSLDGDDSTRAPGPVPRQATDCELEAAGVKPVPVPGFKPTCDEHGNYKAQQCLNQHCWCVNPENGQAVTGSLTEGQANCGRVLVRQGGMSKLLPLPGLDA
ncbi:uncharacterized protein LOC125904097 [Epinephelus fuscoguttatus]|uniref:uncharacterized protein LOC125904097 n=1 Tax=Epinephelus fuscoguttatus TaxID=293821 RepID=UPI0020D0990A|nr:uncharacterized protein LOC125904097 [Epinephelus fuscoguttatus]